jgi:hypothetical protein
MTEQVDGQPAAVLMFFYQETIVAMGVNNKANQ